MIVRRGLALLLSVAALLPLSIDRAFAAPTPPSEQLQAYSANNLEHLLGPLNEGELPRTELSNLAIDYKARLAVANPTEKGVLQAAIDVCTAFDRIMDERAEAVAGAYGGKAANINSLGSTRSAPFKDDKRAEIRGGQHNTDFITDAAREARNKQWKERTPAWRGGVTQLLIREKQAELMVAAAAPAASSAAQTQPPSAAPVEDPAIGEWWSDTHVPITLSADHTMTGGRHGTWVSTHSGDGATVYELHFNPPKNWVDYLTLSPDGKSLTGTTRGSAAIGYYRQ